MMRMKSGTGWRYPKGRNNPLRSPVHAELHQPSKHAKARPHGLFRSKQLRAELLEHRPCPVDDQAEAYGGYPNDRDEP